MGFLVVRGRPKGGQADWRVQTFAAVYHQAGEIPNRLGKRVAEARTFRHKDFSGILKEAGGLVGFIAGLDAARQRALQNEGVILPVRQPDGNKQAQPARFRQRGG